MVLMGAPECDSGPLIISSSGHLGGWGVLTDQSSASGATGGTVLGGSGEPTVRFSVCSEKFMLLAYDLRIKGNWTCIPIEFCY